MSRWVGGFSEGRGTGSPVYEGDKSLILGDVMRQGLPVPARATNSAVYCRWTQQAILLQHRRAVAREVQQSRGRLESNVLRNYFNRPLN